VGHSVPTCPRPTTCSEELEAKRSAAVEAGEATAREEEEVAKSEARVEELTQQRLVLQAEADRLREAQKAAEEQVGNYINPPPPPCYHSVYPWPILSFLQLINVNAG